MGSEVNKFIEKTLEKNQNLFNAEVITFPSEKKLRTSENLKNNVLNHWRINDRSNQDQLNAIIGVCFMIGALTLVGLFSNLI